MGFRTVSETCFSAVAVTGPNKYRTPDAIPGSNIALSLLLSKDFDFLSFEWAEVSFQQMGSLPREVHIQVLGRKETNWASKAAASQNAIHQINSLNET